jgi:hypothetical protein
MRAAVLHLAAMLGLAAIVAISGIGLLGVLPLAPATDAHDSHATPSPSHDSHATPPPAAPTAEGTPVLVAPPPASDAAPTRIRIRSLGIDLAVVSSALLLPGEKGDFPYCDVAQYLAAFARPHQPGTTYVYAHARRGMFEPLLRASEHDDGAALVGLEIELYSSDGVRHRYVLERVKRHAVDFSLAHDVRPGERQLVLQTSEGPDGTLPKLQVAARHEASEPASRAEAAPLARPRPCR